MYVKWNSLLSEGFHVTNGVRQGSVLSPYLFCVYMDELSNRVNTIYAGCLIGDSRVNHLIYADDIVLIAPAASGMKDLLRVTL